MSEDGQENSDHETSNGVDELDDLKDATHEEGTLKRERSPESKRRRNDREKDKGRSKRRDEKSDDRKERSKKEGANEDSKNDGLEEGEVVEPAHEPTARELERMRLIEQLAKEDADLDGPSSSAKDNEQAHNSRACPYLDTIDRKVLDFDFEKLCSVSLSHLNVYACMVCGKYFQGRGTNTHAYTHSLDTDHRVFLNLHTLKFYCLPDNYEVDDPSLEDIKDISRSYASIFTEESAKELPFLYLALDLPPAPLYRDEQMQNIIPQEYKTYNENIMKRFELLRLPEYLIITYKRFHKNQWFVEKNPTIVNFPISNVDLFDCLSQDTKRDHKYTTYDLVANIVHDGKPDSGTYRIQLVHVGSRKWFELEDLHVKEILPQMIVLAESYIQ
ncbi:hypothetical protein OESDEN_14112, partial [Oesophagostomum dentatum]